MPRRRKKHRLPYWIRSQEFRLLNNSEKDFLGYLYSFGPDTCWLWNWRLEKKFHRCRRTIQYWLTKLKKLGFIYIEKPYGPQRKIHARTLPSCQNWVSLIGTLALSKQVGTQKRSKRPRGRPPKPVQAGDSPASIETARKAIINELVRRGETVKTAENVADQVILRSLEKKGVLGCKKLHP